MRVGWDIDGVLYDFGESVREYLRQNPPYHPDMTKPIDHWHFYRDWGLTDAEFVELCHRGVDADVIFSHGHPHGGTVEIMNKVYAMDHKVVIITDRPFGANQGKNSRRATFRWLRKYGYKFHEVHFTADKTTVPVDMMIDDKLENYDALDAAGTEVYLLNRPWNMQQDNRRRLDSVYEYLGKIEEKTYAYI